MIQSVLPCFSHLKSPCRSWCWLSSCWVLLSRNFECVVLLLLLCWWRRVLLLRCWVLLLIVCGCRSESLRPWTWWQSPKLTSALLHILPSRCRRRHRFLEWCPMFWPLVWCRTCSAVFLWCTSVHASASVDLLLLALLRILLAPLLRSWCLVWCRSSTVVCRLPVGMLCVPLCWVAVQGLCCWPFSWCWCCLAVCQACFL